MSIPYKWDISVELLPNVYGTLYVWGGDERSYLLETEVGDFRYGYIKISGERKCEWDFRCNEVRSGITSIDTFYSIAKWATKNLRGEPILNDFKFIGW